MHYFSLLFKCSFFYILTSGLSVFASKKNTPLTSLFSCFLCHISQYSFYVALSLVLLLACPSALSITIHLLLLMSYFSLFILRCSFLSLTPLRITLTFLYYVIFVTAPSLVLLLVSSLLISLTLRLSCFLCHISHFSFYVAPSLVLLLVYPSSLFEKYTS